MTETTPRRETAEPDSSVIPTPSPPAANPLKRFIETCGRHPFATGLFALLSVFGLGFSFVAFGIDQAQSRSEAIETAQIQASLSRVERAIPIAAAPEPAGIDPVASTFDSPATDNVSFPRRYMGRTKAWIEANAAESFSVIPFLPFSVSSAAEKDFVQLAPYVVFDVMTAEPVGPELASIYEGGRGGAAQLREFSAAIVPEPGLQFAPLVDGEGAYRTDVDYFSLMPGEPEEFFVYANYLPGYVYTFRVGVHYKYKGRHGLHWVTPAMRGGVPDYALPLAGAEAAVFEQAVHPDLTSAAAEDLRAQALENRRVVAASRLFNPSQLAAIGPPAAHAAAGRP